MAETVRIAADRLLLVDDNPTNLQVLYQALEAEGYELLVAESGEEALGIAREAKPQLILLDINMPGIDGYETCRRLKADDETKESVVVFLSARGDVDDKVRGLDVGAVDYIGKPFQFEEVVARVRKHLTLHHRHRKLQVENQELKERLEGGFRDFAAEDLKAMAAGGESGNVEFKSTLRWNLHTGKPDKRIENACLKTVAAYLNSAGGVLLVGVDDQGRALGLAQDQFANEDKLLLHWNGLINQHLGVECTPCVRSELADIDSQRVLVVQCLASSKPVFLSRDNDEVFFVRAGNRTQPLKPSEVLAYLDQREAGPPPATVSTTAQPRQIGQYTLDEEIGSGGMGTVYRAHHAMLQRPAAIKLLDAEQANESSVARFEREVQRTSQLTHPNTIAIYDYGRTPAGVFYYAMEYLDGMNLQDLVQSDGPQSEGRVIHILAQVCGALAEAHEIGLIHRDIKPPNIMIGYRGGQYDFVTLLDFGLVKAVGSAQEAALTASGVLTGTPLYISPEGLDRPDELGPCSDVYSLGAVGYYMLTARPVFEGDSLIDICMKHAATPPQPPSEKLGQPIAEDLEQLILQCIEKQPEGRPQGAKLLRERLLSCQAAGSWTQQDASSWWTSKQAQGT